MITNLYDIEWEQVVKLCGIEITTETDLEQDRNKITIRSKRFNSKWVANYSFAYQFHESLVSSMAIRQYIRDSQLNKIFGEIKI